MMFDRTHDPARLSWVESANDPQTDFPIQNLPYGIFRTARNPSPRLGVAIGTQIYDLTLAADARQLPPEVEAACRQSSLNALMALGPARWSLLRTCLANTFCADTIPEKNRTIFRSCLLPQASAEMLLPARIGGYTDFYASLNHATLVGSLFRPEQPLLPNYKWVPIGYHGRTSSLSVSGTPVRRPRGQLRTGAASPPEFAPSNQLDYELELGALVGPGNPPGEPIPIAQAPQHLFGVVLLNDWSARDIQAWEYQPLGPFLGKNFATTISPWVVTMEALAPFRTTAFARPQGDPAPLAYLHDPADAAGGGLDLTLEVHLLTSQMRAEGLPPHRVSAGSFRDMYWTLAQLLTHHASNGCNLQPGDLLGSGTVSGKAPGARGCLLELTLRGNLPLTLPNGEERRFLTDGDEVILRGFAEKPGARRIGLGECRGRILAARD